MASPTDEVTITSVPGSAPLRSGRQQPSALRLFRTERAGPSCSGTQAVMGRRRRIDASVGRERLLLTALPSLVIRGDTAEATVLTGPGIFNRLPGHTTMGKSHRNYTTAGRTVELQGGFSARSRRPDRSHGLAGGGVPYSTRLAVSSGRGSVPIPIRHEPPRTAVTASGCLGASDVMGSVLGRPWSTRLVPPVPLTPDLGMTPGQLNRRTLNQWWKVRMLAG
jgi:hypothetical protein